MQIIIACREIGGAEDESRVLSGKGEFGEGYAELSASVPA